MSSDSPLDIMNKGSEHFRRLLFTNKKNKRSSAVEQLLSTSIDNSQLSDKQSRLKPADDIPNVISDKSHEKLDEFFDQMGINSKHASTNSMISVPTSDSCQSISSQYDDHSKRVMDTSPTGSTNKFEPENITRHTSIVEKNARIIKWICNVNQS